MTRFVRVVEATADGFAEPVQWVGVYALRWHDQPTQPTVAFVETDVVDKLLAACEKALEWAAGWPLGSCYSSADGRAAKEVCEACEVAIAAVKGD